MSYIFTRKDL